MGSNDNDKDDHYKLMLAKDNWDVWIEQMGDYIMALDHDDAPDIWKAYVWTPADGGNDPDTVDYQAGGNSAAKKLRTKHNKAFKYIRDRLSKTVCQRTMGIERSVPKLLRALRDYVHDGGVADRGAVRKDFLSLTLEDFGDMEEYVVAFNNKRSSMKSLSVNMVEKDEDTLYFFKEGLPSAYKTLKTLIEVNKMTLLDAQKLCILRPRTMNHFLEH
jgi:hypothetical protein